MAAQRIYLLEKLPLKTYKCQRCGETTRRSKFIWISWFSKDKTIICRECAYKESFGTKNIKQAKKERILEEKENNQERN
tara:strand:+ start:377 stop:613 length:237 start_codon:yes stop_codon:yes gene_type:complete